MFFLWNRRGVVYVFYKVANANQFFQKERRNKHFLKRERKETNARLQCFNPVGGKQSCNSAGYVCAHLQARQVWTEGRSTEFQFLLFRE